MSERPLRLRLQHGARLWLLVVAALGIAIAAGAAWAALVQEQGGAWVQLTIGPVPSRIDAVGAASADDYMPSRIEALLARGPAGGDKAEEPPVVRTALQAITRIARGAPELWIGRLASPASALPRGVRVMRLDWATGPMAIMRSDTDIRDWRDLQNRTVCVPIDGRHTGRLARDYGAIEQVYPAAAHALVALRVGECDAAVADASLLQQLLQYPEWKKFSARLLPLADEPLVALWPSRLSMGQHRRLRQVVGKTALQQARQTLARSIAFEVYLDQEAPDCHS